MADSRRPAIKPLCAPAMWVEAPAQLQHLHRWVMSGEQGLGLAKARPHAKDKVSDFLYRELLSVPLMLGTQVGSASSYDYLTLTPTDFHNAAPSIPHTRPRQNPLPRKCKHSHLLTSFATGARPPPQTAIQELVCPCRTCPCHQPSCGLMEKHLGSG